MNTRNLRTRYPGLSSFTTAQKDLFFGRDQEIRDLSNLISVERTVVLFSKSGYGKTSLLQAGVMPLLYGQQMVPVPIRFGTDALLPEQHFSIQLQEAWLRFWGRNSEKATDSSATETFWEQVARSPFGAAPARFTPLLIFDQFEELFTLYPDENKRRRFVSDLADLVQERMPARLKEALFEKLEKGTISGADAAMLETAPPVKFIFSIRSDMLHFVDELSDRIPYILRSRYQLFGLKESSAREAITAPAGRTGEGFATSPFAYQPAALDEIVATLSKNKEVESFQLQAVCQAIEEKLIQSEKGRLDLLANLSQNGNGLPQIDATFYGGSEGIDDILEESYYRRINRLADTNPAWPEAARLMLEDALVNINDRRQSVDIVSLLSRKNVNQPLLDELEQQRLLRREPRLDSFYYEISHDTWLKPIVKSRKIRQDAEKTRRLEEETALLRSREIEAYGRQRRAQLLSGAAIAAAILAIAIGIWAVKQKETADTAKKEAEHQLINFIKERIARRESEIKDLKRKTQIYNKAERSDLVQEATQQIDTIIVQLEADRLELRNIENQ